MSTEAPPVPRHPARWNADVLGLAEAYVVTEGARLGRTVNVLDPFAGTGAVHRIRTAPDGVHGGIVTVGVELEPEWAAAHPGTVCGDVLNMPAAWADRFDVCCSSPSFASRMADDHDARDLCKRCDGTGTIGAHDDRHDAVCPVCKGEKLSRRNTYRHALGRPLSPGSSAGMQWGPEYRSFHKAAMVAILAAVRPGGLLLWNAKNHYRDGAEQLVAEWHLRQWLEFRCRLVRVDPIPARGNRQGQNGNLRTEAEFLLVLRAPDGSPVVL